MPVAPAGSPEPLGAFRLAAVCCAFAEEDVIEATVLNAFAQGVDEVLLIDNESPDGTVEFARAAGATIAGSLHMPVHREDVRIGAINRTVREWTTRFGDDHVWWLHLDADELPTGPGGLTIRQHLAQLDRRFRVVGSTHYDHYPSGPRANERGRHPIDLQPLCERQQTTFCAGGHYKHPLLRADRGGEPLEAGLGTHLPVAGAHPWPEPRIGLVTHHFQFRDEDATRRRMALIAARVDKERPVRARMACVDAVYAQRWSEVPLRRTRLGNRPVRPRPYTEVLSGDDARVHRWYDGASGAVTGRPADAPAEISILLEWDNPRRSNRHLPPETLRRLAAQAARLDRRLELLVGHGDDVPPAEIDAALIEADVARHLPVDAVRRVPTGAVRYYEIKNALAEEATGDLLVFVDSDVLPEDGWLPAILAPFEGPDCHVVCGQTYVGPLDSFYDRAIASIWFFPPRRDGDEIVAVDHFYANNVAFRREVFLAHRFDVQPDRFRGQCLDLARRLRADGVEIHRTLAAATMHPPPEIPGDLVSRALLDGSDWARPRRHLPLGDFLAQACRYGVRGFAYAAWCAVRDRREVRLGPLEVVGAVALAACLWSLRCVGVVADRLRPGVLLRFA